MADRQPNNYPGLGAYHPPSYPLAHLLAGLVGLLVGLLVLGVVLPVVALLGWYNPDLLGLAVMAGGVYLLGRRHGSRS